VVDPKNPDVAYVAAMGHLWANGGERGLSKTTDGGKTWKLILQAAAPHNARTGCGDVILDPSNPQTVYAALYAPAAYTVEFHFRTRRNWRRRRWWNFQSTNGGTTWKKLSGGLPPADWSDWSGRKRE